MADLIATSRVAAVVGLGASGLATARFLAREGKPFVLLDTRSKPPLLDAFLKEFPDITPECGPLNSETLNSVAQIILSPGLAKNMPEIQAAEQAGVEVIGDIELFARHANAPIVAITGSNGKTTVTTLVGGMAKAAGLNVLVGGNIGTPALDLLAEPTPNFYVLELSSFQLETTQHLNAFAATVLNVTKDHLDRYSSFMAYHRAKMRILFGAKNVVVNRQDLLTRGPISQDVNQISFGLNVPDLKDFGIIEHESERYLAKGLDALLPVAEVKLHGSHNLSNALAAMALVDLMGGLNQAALSYLSNFTGIDHRCQWVAKKSGVTFFNDSKATNVGATIAAVQGLTNELADKNAVHLILGGQSKGGDFNELLPALKSKVASVQIYGEDAEIIHDTLVNANNDQARELQIEKVQDLNSAVQSAFTFAKSGDYVLLSPACASFDMFSGYEERGRVFMSAVEAIAE